MSGPVAPLCAKLSFVSIQVREGFLHLVFACRPAPGELVAARGVAVPRLPGDEAAGERFCLPRHEGIVHEEERLLGHG